MTIAETEYQLQSDSSGAWTGEDFSVETIHVEPRSDSTGIPDDSLFAKSKDGAAQISFDVWLSSKYDLRLKEFALAIGPSIHHGATSRLEPNRYQCLTLRYPDTIPDQIDAMIDRAYLPRRWIEEGVTPPTLKCRFLTKEICKAIYELYEMIPSRIVASKEEGLYVVYHHLRNGRSFSLEIDNELDCIAQVYDQRNIFLTDSFESDNELKTFMNYFNV